MSRWLGITCSTACLWLVALPVPASSQDTESPIRTAFDLCTDLPKDIELARETLKAEGWQSEDTAAFEALVNSNAVFQFRVNELDYTFQNAAFMAASILGNSALGRDQIGMQSDDHTLAVLGINEGTPYCVVTGPTSLLGAFQEYERIQPRGSISADFVSQIMGQTHDNVAFTVGWIETDSFNEAVNSSDMSEEDADRFVGLMNPATLAIYPSEVTQ